MLALEHLSLRAISKIFNDEEAQSIIETDFGSQTWRKAYFTLYYIALYCVEIFAKFDGIMYL